MNNNDKAKRMLFGRTDIGDEEPRIGDDNICPVTKLPCDDECCPPGAICNISGHDLSMSPEPPIDTSMDIQQNSDPIELICTKCHNNFYMGLEHYRMLEGPAICSACLKPWTEEDTKRAIENIEFVKPDFTGIDKLGKIDSDYAKEADKLMHSNPSMDTQNDELAKIAKEMMETHVFPEPWIKAICDYCYQNNITPDQLIAQHQNYKTAVFQTAAKPPKE